MEPRIQYAKTADGVSIAFWTLGEGPALVHMPLQFSHAQLEWRFPEYRDWYERLAQGRMLIRYDGRGCGLSQRDLSEYSLDALSLDLDAVVNRLDLDRFVLFGAGPYGQVAIAYAAHNPERVSHLVLWCAWARTLDTASPRFRGIRRLLDIDWDLYTETVAHVVAGWSEGEPARRQAALNRDSVTQRAAQAFVAANREFDVTGLLPQVRSRTLVLHRGTWLSVDVAMNLASHIKDAGLTLLEGGSGAPYLGDTQAVLRAIDEFLRGAEEAAGAAEPPEAGAFRTILFTDVEGSTALTQRLGDARAREVLRTHERIVREALRSHGGSEVKTMGDGFMASFSSATGALECAIAMQRAFAEWNAGVGAQGLAPLQIRIGLNAGEPIAEEAETGREDLFGTAVNLAARIAAKAEGGEVLASDVVRQLVAGKGFLFADRGETALRGFEDPVRLYEVRWREA